MGERTSGGGWMHDDKRVKEFRRGMEVIHNTDARRGQIDGIWYVDGPGNSVSVRWQDGSHGRYTGEEAQQHLDPWKGHYYWRMELWSKDGTPLEEVLITTPEEPGRHYERIVKEPLPLEESWLNEDRPVTMHETGFRRQIFVRFAREGRTVLYREQ